MTTPPGRTVVFAPNWLGDVVMALPAVADVRRQFAAAHLAVAARAKVAPLFDWVPGVDEVLRLSDAPAPLWRPQAGPDAACLAAGRYDVAVLLPNSFRSAWLARRAGIGERWGYRRDGRGWLLTRAVARPPRRGHQAKYYQALTRALGMPNGPCAVRLDPPEAVRARARALLDEAGCAPGRPVVGLAPGAAYGHAKQWPPERFAELIRRLADAGITAVLLGSRGDAGAGRAIEGALGARTAGRAGLLVNLIGRTDVAALAGVLAGCASVVSNDSGAMHLAGAVGAPVTAVFGASDERRTAPLPYAAAPADAGSGDGRHVILTHAAWCRPCMLRECPIDHRCMTGVGADRVFEAVMRQVNHA